MKICKEIYLISLLKHKEVSIEFNNKNSHFIELEKN